MCPPAAPASLAAPRAASWGEFNPDYFLMPDGRTLAEHRA